jgi:hypothetical protein
VDLIKFVLGYGPTQAEQCAILAHSKGKYIVKSYKQVEEAEAAYEQFAKRGIKTRVIETKH